jgi:hypothetical protein
MERETMLLKNTVGEYRGIMVGIEGRKVSEAYLEWSEVQDRLRADADWTEKGAGQISRLARRYGSFVLRNALALAIVLNIEDGELGL